MWVLPLGGEEPLEHKVTTHSSILAWGIPWTEEPGRLQSMGSQRVGHGWACTCTSAPTWTRRATQGQDAGRGVKPEGCTPPSGDSGDWAHSSAGVYPRLPGDRRAHFHLSSELMRYPQSKVRPRGRFWKSTCTWANQWLATTVAGTGKRVTLSLLSPTVKGYLIYILKYS